MKTTSQTLHHDFILDSAYACLRLDQAITKQLAHYSRCQIQQWIHAGEITVNGQKVASKYKVRGGEAVNLHTILTAHGEEQAEAIPLQLVYEDEALLIVNKPAGMVVHPAPGHRQQTLVNALLYYHPPLALLPRAGIVHRLDKQTSGLLLVAKTERSLKYLNQELKKRRIRREYQAIICGTLISGGTIAAPIGRHPLLRKQMAVVDTGKSAITHYRILQKFRAHTHLTVQLETGRTHQIRVHMAHIQHPIVGDPLYNKRLSLPKHSSVQLRECLQQFKRQALHATRLQFAHPITGENRQFTCELPSDMNELVGLLRYC